MSFLRVLNNLFRFNRTNWKAVSLCFLAATVFWFFNALNKDYATNLRFPLQFEFDQQKFVPSKPLPSDVYMNVSGKGWDLLRKYLGLKLPVIIPLERPADTKKIVGSVLPSLLASQMGTLKINHIVTDTLYLSIENKGSRRMKVYFDDRLISFKDGFGRTSPVVILPDSVELEGPVSSVHRLPDSLIVTLPSSRLSSNYREQLEVKIDGNEVIKRNPPVVDAMFEVGKVTAVRSKVKVSLYHVPDLYRVMQDKDSITCVIQIPADKAEEFEQIKSNLTAAIDLQDARTGGRKVLPMIANLPSYALLLGSDSVRLRLSY